MNHGFTWLKMLLLESFGLFSFSKNNFFACQRVGSCDLPGSCEINLSEKCYPIAIKMDRNTPKALCISFQLLFSKQIQDGHTNAKPGSAEVPYKNNKRKIIRVLWSKLLSLFVVHTQWKANPYQVLLLSML